MDPTRSNASVAAGGSDRAGIIVVDRARKILFKNGVAERALESGGSLFERQQRLGSRTQSIDMRLRAALLGGTRGPGADDVPHLVHLPRPSGLPLCRGRTHGRSTDNRRSRCRSRRRSRYRDRR